MATSEMQFVNCKPYHSEDIIEFPGTADIKASRYWKVWCAGQATALSQSIWIKSMR